MEEQQQIKFIDLVLKSIIAVIGVFILILLLFRAQNTFESKIERNIMCVDSLVMIASIMLSYYSINNLKDRLLKIANFMFFVCMTTLVGFAAIVTI